MKELVNNKITDVLISDSEHCLKFINNNNEELHFVVNGDCCSESWFSEIINLDNLINQSVLEVNTLNLPNYLQDQDTHGRQDIDIFYGYEIKSTGGTTTIVFRNSSNGYYGGDCEYLDLLRQNKPPWKFVSIKHLQDWTAYQPVKTSYVHALKLRAFL